MTEISVCWFRRDLRLVDNAALYHALKSPFPVLCLFVFDEQILSKLEDKSDKRVLFIHQALENMQTELLQMGSSLDVRVGNPAKIWTDIITEHNVKQVFTNHDYEPYAQTRDEIVKNILIQKNIPFLSFKDQCIFEKDEITKDDGKPYTVFTPYSRKWKAKISDFYLKSYPCEKYYNNFYKTKPLEIPSIEKIGFKALQVNFPSIDLNEKTVKSYDQTRDIPAILGTTRQSVHLRFGTVSIRKLAQKAQILNETWLNELIWRDFYMMILYQFPHVATNGFRKEYDKIHWLNNENDFEAWCNGQTGYPLVDAGMRELNQTGFMHNRVRMVVASFLTKHLLIDWRWGEAYFAKKLLDFDLSANNGGWQWAAGSGCDAAPYFRVFNPTLQMEKFDKDKIYIKKWVPEFSNPFAYTKPIVNHEFARKRVLETYSLALKG